MTDTIYAGHGQKSLTCETTPAGVSFLYVNIAGESHLISLTPDERRSLSEALLLPGQTREIATY